MEKLSKKMLVRSLYEIDLTTKDTLLKLLYLSYTYNDRMEFIRSWFSYKEANVKGLVCTYNDC